MKRCIGIICMLLSFVQLSLAQVKVVETSSKRAPEWIGVTVLDHITVSAESETLDGAKQKCLADIRQTVITGVAVYVSSEEYAVDYQVSNNGKNANRKMYSSQVQSIAAKIPYISGVSLNESEIYWKKLYNKSNKTYKYEVHVKYPFSRQTQRELVDAFLQFDKSQDDRLASIRDKYSTFDQVEYIATALNDLKALQAYFVDDVRKAEVVALMDNYRKLYKAITIVPYSSTLGEIIYCLKIGDRQVISSRKPVVSSDYATQLEHSFTDDNMYRITYRYDYCMPGDENKIDVVHKYASGSSKHTFYFDVSKEKVEIVPFGQMELLCHGVKDGNTTEIKVSVDIRSKWETPFIVESIDFSTSRQLKVNGKNSLSVSGKGVHRIKFDAIGNVPSEERNSDIASGVMRIKNISTGKTQEIKFTLPYKIITL